MLGEEPTAGPASKARRSRSEGAATKTSVNGTRSAAQTRTSGRGRAAPHPLEEEGLFESGGQPFPAEEGLFELSPQVGVRLAGPASGAPPPPLAPPKLGRVIHVTWARFWIALCSIIILTFVVVASFVTLWLGSSVESLTRVLEILFAPLVALVGVAVAFYYRGGGAP